MKEIPVATLKSIYKSAQSLYNKHEIDKYIMREFEEWYRGERRTEKMIQWTTVLLLIEEFFNDSDKTVLWFCMPNPLLGGIIPRDMIQIGGFNKLLLIIEVALDENRRD